MVAGITKKSWVIVAWVMLFAVTAFLYTTQQIYAESIKDKIKATQGENGGMSELETSVDDSTNSLVTSVRRIAISGSIIMLFWIGSLYARGGFNFEALKEAKGKITIFIVFIAFTFWTERLLGFLFNILGIDISNL